MKVVAASLASVAILAAGFGVYRLVSGGDEEHARAETAAEELTAFCKGQCDVVRMERISTGLWRFHVRDPVGGSRCLAVELENFRVFTRDSMYVGGSTEGVADTPCGPEWWSPEDATRRVRASNWAEQRKKEFISCGGRGGSPGRSIYFRRFACRYSYPAGADSVEIETTGPDTFQIVGR